MHNNNSSTANGESSNEVNDLMMMKKKTPIHAHTLTSHNRTKTIISKLENNILCVLLRCVRVWVVAFEKKNIHFEMDWLIGRSELDSRKSFLEIKVFVSKFNNCSNAKGELNSQLLLSLILTLCTSWVLCTNSSYEAQKKKQFRINRTNWVLFFWVFFSISFYFSYV